MFMFIHVLKSTRIVEPIKRYLFETLNGLTHGTIATSIDLSQLMGCMGFSVIVAIAPGEY